MTRTRFSISHLGFRMLAATAMCIAIIGGASLSFAADLPDVLPYGIETLPATPTVRAKGDQQTVDLAGQSIADPYIPRRVQAQTDLGASQSPAAARYVRAGIADADAQVRVAAAHAASAIGEPTLTADLKKLLHDADARVRREAVLSGAALGDGSFIDAGLADADGTVIAAAVSVATPSQAGKIAAALQSYPPVTQVIALRSLGRLGDAAHANAAAQFLTAAPPLRVAAITALGQMKATAQSGEVIKLLADEHPTIRREVLFSLPGLVPTGEVHAHCIAALADADLSVREAAARVLQTALADADLSVREAAARVLQTAPTAAALDALIANLPSESARLHTAARDALVAIGPPTIPAAEKLLTDPTARRREDGSYLLGQLKSDASLAVHIKLTEDKDGQVVRQAAVSLGLIGRKEASPAIAKLANLAAATTSDAAPDPAMYAAVEPAIISSAQLGDASILPVCRAILPGVKTISPNYRAAAAYAIGRLADPADRSLAGLFNRQMNHPEEVFAVQFECVKAMGHLKLPAAPWAGKDRASAGFTGDAHVDWLTHWVRWRLTGQTEPVTPFEESNNSQPSLRPMRN